MRRLARIPYLVVAILASTLMNVCLSSAQDADFLKGKTLALPEVVKEALARNPEILAARKQWEAATQRIAQARTLDDPTLSVQWWNAPESFNLGRAENTIIGLSQKFPFPGKLALREAVAGRSADMTAQAVRAKERDLITRLKQAYYDLFFALKAIQIHHEQRDLLKQVVEIANAKFRAGKGSQVDVLKAQVELSTLHQELPVLEQRRDTAQGKLNVLLDRDPRFPLAPPQAPREERFGQDLEDLFHTATSVRPEIRAADLAVQRNEQSHALARREYYPDINVDVQRFQNFQANNGFGAVLSINLPFAFWTKPKYDAVVQEASAAVAASRAEQRTLENLTRFQIRDLLAKIRAAWEVAVLYRTTVLPQSEQSVAAARAGYRTGGTGFLDLIEADRAWRGYQLEFYRALVEREQRFAELEQVIGADLNRNDSEGRNAP